MERRDKHFGSRKKYGWSLSALQRRVELVEGKHHAAYFSFVFIFFFFCFSIEHSHVTRLTNVYDFFFLHSEHEISTTRHVFRYDRTPRGGVCVSTFVRLKKKNKKKTSDQTGRTRNERRVFSHRSDEKPPEKPFLAGARKNERQ